MFWDTTWYIPVKIYHLFGEIRYKHEAGSGHSVCCKPHAFFWLGLLSGPEDGGDVFLQTSGGFHTT
jgi:hypothetical protein